MGEHRRLAVTHPLEAFLASRGWREMASGEWRKGSALAPRHEAVIAEVILGVSVEWDDEHAIGVVRIPDVTLTLARLEDLEASCHVRGRLPEPWAP